MRCGYDPASVSGPVGDFLIVFDDNVVFGTYARSIFGYRLGNRLYAGHGQKLTEGKMEDPNFINGFTILFVSTSLLLTILSVPMILRRVKPNPLYGFRTAKTLAKGNEDVWYDAN